MASDVDVASQFKQELRGTGQLRRNGVAIELQGVRVERKKYDPTSEWEFQAIVPDYQRDVWNKLLAPGPGALEFHGKLQWGPELFIPHLYDAASYTHEFQAHADEIVMGPQSLSRVPTKQWVQVELWANPIALPEIDDLVQWWTGEIKAHRARKTKKSKRVIPKIDFTIGALRYSEHYAFDQLEVAEVKSRILIPRPTLHGNVRRAVKTSKIGSLRDELAADVDDFTRLLTFLSRRHVRWSRIDIRNQWPEEKKRHYVEQTTIRASISTKSQRSRDRLINPYRLEPDDLNTLFRTYKASPMKRSMSSAIIYVVAAYDAEFVDARIANAYTAFEAMVSAVNDYSKKSHTMASGPFDRLARRLRSEISDFAESSGIAPEVAQTVITKLPELRRRSIVDQALDAIVGNRVEWKDLWPPATDLQAALKAVYSRRHLFIHTGNLGNVHQASVDAERLLVLTERLIFELLKGKANWQDGLSFRLASLLRAETEPVTD
jgi:hypothetical protein